MEEGDPYTAELGGDLAALVRASRRVLRDVRPLSRRGVPPRATSFRLCFAAGPDLKGVILDHAARATTVAELASHLSGGLPRIVARCGAALLTEWVAGEDLRSAGYDEVILRACGAWQARVHTQPVPHRLEAGECLRQYSGTLCRKLGALRSAGALDAPTAAALEAYALAAVPARCELGILLGDCCAENLVWHDDAPCFVDLETLALGPLDYDLARTWYRWPMAAAERRAWLAGYAARRPPEAFLAHFPFWATAALVNGAVFRLAARPEGAAVPLAALRALCAALAGGARGMALLGAA